MDMMASAQRIPRGFEYERRQLPFFSRYETEGSAGVEVFSPDVTIVPTSKRECFGFHFPPPKLVGVVLQYLEERKTHAVVSNGTKPEKVVVSQVRRGDNTCRADL